MKKYIALLRGINVSGHKKILMADLKALIGSLGFRNVTTYIQSGNVVFEAAEKTGLATKISKAIFENYGWEVPVLITTASEINAILTACPFSDEKKIKSYFTLFYEIPTDENIEIAKLASYPGEEFHITHKCMYYYCAAGYGQAKMNNNFFKTKLKVTVTTRNYRTMVKLLEMASE